MRRNDRGDDIDSATEPRRVCRRLVDFKRHVAGVMLRRAIDRAS